MTETERKLKAGETLTEGFCVYRGDSRDIQPNIDRETGIAFYVGRDIDSGTNSSLAQKILPILTAKGLDTFGTRWKASESFKIIEAIDNTFYIKSTPTVTEVEKQHDLVRNSSYMNGIATNTADSQKTGFDYIITIPKPNENGYKCVNKTQNSVNKCSLYQGETYIYKEGKLTKTTIMFLAIFRGFDCEVVFFTNIPKTWVNYK